jgi:hypothetical protein
MATKSSAKPSARARAGAKKSTAKAAPKAAASSATFTMPPQPDFRDLAKMAKVLTPEQAFELYKTNAKMALTTSSTQRSKLTTKLRKLQFAGEEEARSMQKGAGMPRKERSTNRSWRRVRRDAGIGKAMRYWGKFDMIVKCRKRLFVMGRQRPGAGRRKRRQRWR